MLLYYTDVLLDDADMSQQDSTPTYILYSYFTVTHHTDIYSLLLSTQRPAPTALSTSRSPHLQGGLSGGAGDRGTAPQTRSVGQRASTGGSGLAVGLGGTGSSARAQHGDRETRME